MGGKVHTGGEVAAPVSRAGHVMIATTHYPPVPTAVSHIMHELLKGFDPGSYTVATARHKAVKGAYEVSEGRREDVRYIMSSVGWSKRLDKRWRDAQVPYTANRLVRLIEQRNSQVLVGVYPDFHFLAVAQRAARDAQIPWVAYLHDTVAEGLISTRFASRAKQLQQRVFDEAAQVLVMSQGMKDLYTSKYGLSCTALEHPYAEPVSESLPYGPAERQAFWSGRVYGINERAFARVVEALEAVDCPILMTTTKTKEGLRAQGIQGNHIKTAFYPSRDEYLQVLRRQGLLVLALDSPDESPVHEDELATIFPTKTPEYLAMGRPILVHCPEHYFLARFFEERGCGLVVSERSTSALEEACRYLLQPSEAVEEMCRSALTAARHFDAKRIVARFSDEVNQVATMN